VKRSIRTGTCRQCGEEYLKRAPLQKACSLDCALAMARQKRQKAQEKERRKRDAKVRERLKTRSQWLKEAQAAFNGYIRARDHGKPCISCGSEFGDVVFGGKADAGHYRSTGAAGHLRLNFLNCHVQCVRCNRHLSSNAVAYRRGLVKRIGEDRVINLENDNEPRSFDIEYLRRAKKIFNKRARYYRKRRGI